MLVELYEFLEIFSKIQGGMMVLKRVLLTILLEIDTFQTNQI